MASDDNLIVVRFRNEPYLHEVKTKEKGRPIYVDREICEIRFAGDRQKVAVFPAHDLEPNATRERGEPVSWAQVYNKQYMQFKNQEQQTVNGTPLSEAPFLLESRRRELRAINIHSVESLAAIDGQPLKMLGMDGRELKNQARAYLDKASETAGPTALAAENVDLRRQLADMQRQMAATAPASQGDDDDDADEAEQPEGEEKSLEDCTAEELKAYIKRETGAAPRGNPNRDTLYNLAMEVYTTPPEQRRQSAG